MSETQTENLDDYINQTAFSDDTKTSLMEILPKIFSTSKNDINLDEADVKTILENGNVIFAGSGQHTGDDAPMYAIKSAITNASFDYKFMSQITGVLIHFRIHPDASIVELEQGMNMIYRDANEDASIIWGTKDDATISKNYTEATVLISVFKKKL